MPVPLYGCQHTFVMSKRGGNEPPFTDKALDAIGELFFVFTGEGEILQWNQRVNEVTGYTDDEIAVMHPVQFVVEEDVDAIRRHMKKVLETGQTRFEARYLTKDGREIPYEFTGSLLEHGGEKLICGTGRDITEKKRTEVALRESEEQYRRLFEESRDAVILTTPDGEIVDANEAAEALYGYSRNEMLSLDAAELYADPAERSHRIVPALEEASSSLILEAEMRHREGHTFLASASVTVHRDEQGQPEMIQALVRDITERRRLQQEVLRVQEQERRRLGQDLHDGIASQLTGATLKLNLLARKTDDKAVVEDVQEVQKIIEESAEEVRRLSHGLNPGGLSEGDLPAALQGLASSTEGVHFEGLPEFDTPNGPGTEAEHPSSASSDGPPTHLYRIAQEAVANAQRHGHAQHIEIRLGSKEGHLVLEVEDDGKGFDPTEIEDEGLGLRSMRHRAELLGAELDVDSAPGEGTLIRCRLSA